METVEENDMDMEQEEMNNMDDFDDNALKMLEETFALFDFEHDGHILTVDLGTIIRGLGFNLTEKKINELVNLYDETGSGSLDFPTFYRLMRDNRPMPGPCREEDVLEDFKVFDIYKDGHISAMDLMDLLLHKGEPMTQEDVDNLMGEIEIDGDNRVNIQHLVQHMFETSAI